MNRVQRQKIHDHMARFADGDRAAFRPVFDELWPLMVAFCTGMRLDPSEAEDAAQQALLKVFSRIVDLDRSRDAVSWALTIAAYEVLTLRKQRTRRREADEALLVERADVGVGPEEDAIARDLAAALLEALGELNARDQEALRDVLADVQSGSGETGRKRRYRAIQRLKDLWWRIHD